MSLERIYIGLLRSCGVGVRNESAQFNFLCRQIFHCELKYFAVMMILESLYILELLFYFYSES